MPHYAPYQPRGKERPAKPLTLVPPSVHRVVDTPGNPLGTAVRHEMSARFGHDFSRVRVHAGPEAEESARDVEALAYTVGPHIVFGTGRYAPETDEGRGLIAHELGHVVEQSAPGVEPRLARASVPVPTSFANESEVEVVFDRLAEKAGVQIAKQVKIRVRDPAGNWIEGRPDRIVKLPNGILKIVEVKLDPTSSWTPPQQKYIPLIKQGALIEIIGDEADAIGLPRGTQTSLPIQIINSYNVADTVRELGLRPPRTGEVVKGDAGGRPAPEEPSGFETARESAEEVPRSPKAARRAPPAAPAAAAPEGEAAMPRVRPRSLAYEAPPAEVPSAAVKGGTTAAGIAMPIVGIADELLTGDDMLRIRQILGSGRAPNSGEQEFMKSWGLLWQPEQFSYTFASVGWWVYWVGKTFLNPFVLAPEANPAAAAAGGEA